MADVDIVVDSGDLKVAIDLANQYGVSFTKLVNTVQTESNRLARASKATSDQVTEAYRRMEAAVNTKQAEAALQKRANVERLLAQHAKARMDKEREAAASAKELERETRQLTAAYNPLLAAEQQYLRMIDDISRARKLKILDDKQEAAALDNLEREGLKQYIENFKQVLEWIKNNELDAHINQIKIYGKQFGNILYKLEF